VTANIRKLMDDDGGACVDGREIALIPY